jgi:hypothetical protein
MHLPAAHVVPAPHFTPQAPQLLVSVLTLVHDPAQEVRPVLQVARHIPAEQLCADVQVVPQAPQFLGSLVSSTQVPPQLV